MSKTNSCKLSVDGMHCASCEVLIEKKLKKVKGVKSVDASLNSNEVKIVFEGRNPDINEINNAFKGTGYTFSLEQETKHDDSPLFIKEGKSLRINMIKMRNWLKGLLVISLVLIGFSVLNSTNLGAKVAVSQNASLGSFFVFGLIAGISSCAALVGTLLLSLSDQWSQLYAKQKNKKERFLPFIMFNSGRLLSFAFLGALLGILGKMFGLGISSNHVITGIIVSLVSVYMMLLGFDMLGFRGLEKFQFKMPKFLSRKISDEENFKGKYMPFIVGALTFFLPCGFTINVQTLALTTSDPIKSALMLLFFALGTLPLLLLISFTSVQVYSNSKVKEVFKIAAGVLVVVFSLYNLNAQLNVMGLPSLSDIKLFNAVSVEYTSTIDADKQILNTKASSNGYFPANATVKAGVPITWLVTDDGTTGCTNGIISRDLFGSKEVNLVYGKNTISLPALEPGTYKYSCWMGMYSGTIRAI